MTSDTGQFDPLALLHLRRDEQEFLLPVTSLLQCLVIAIADGCIPRFEDGWLDQVLPDEYKIANLNAIPEP